MPRKPKSTPKTVAFAGSGEVSEELVKALLTDFFGDDDVFAIIPATVRRGQKGLKQVEAFLKDADIQYDPEEENEFIGKLHEYRKEGDEVTLVLLWTGDETEERLLDEALAADIPVKDLTRALDDISFAEEDEEETPVEPEPAPPSRTRGTPRSSQGKSSRASRGALRAAEDTAARKADADEAQATTEVAQVVQEVSSNLTDLNLLFIYAFETYISLAVDAALDERGIKVKTVGVLVDEDGNYRVATKGRPRKAETPATLTISEAKRLIPGFTETE